jgi:YgiT-type zinc finger domain-containing protein
MTTPDAFGYRCDYCDGTVLPKRVAREAFKHRHGFVILEDVAIDVCDTCGSRYFSAATLRRVQQVASGAVSAERTESVPVAHG